MKRSIMKEAMRIKFESRLRYVRHFRFVRNYAILVLICCALILGGVYLYRSLTNLISETQPHSYTQVHLQKVIVHFDLKGAPPDLRYLRQVLRQVKDLGADGILLEYSDMFPYNEDIKNLSSPFHYHRIDLMKFLSRAASLNLEVIPLIQTFGHMEHALKLAEYQHLREDPLYPDSICPSKNGSLDLLRKMVEQVLFVHKHVTPLVSVHIGGGEVHHLNTCPDCTKRGLPDSTLYLEHIKAVVKMVKVMSPHVATLVWDDMFRGTNISQKFQEELLQLGKKYRIQPVVWDYTVGLSGLSHEHMKLYQKAFKGMWLASAYKGADGEEAVEPDLKQRLLNNLNWLKFAARHKDMYNFNGLILTGRSRYAHLQPLCELLPMSYRTLTTTLLIINEIKHGCRRDNDSLMYTLKDWELASRRYFDDAFERIEMCGIDFAIQFRAECKLITVETSLLRDSVTAYASAVKNLDDSFYTFNIEAKVAFSYMDRDTVSVFLLTTFNLTEFIRFRRTVLRRAMRMFYSENVYSEYISYKYLLVNEKQNYDLIKGYIQSRYQSENNSPHEYIFWPRGRNFTVQS